MFKFCVISSKPISDPDFIKTSFYFDTSGYTVSFSDLPAELQIDIAELKG
jgi:hypothetical protein